MPAVYAVRTGRTRSTERRGSKSTHASAPQKIQYSPTRRAAIQRWTLRRRRSRPPDGSPSSLSRASSANAVLVLARRYLARHISYPLPIAALYARRRGAQRVRANIHHEPPASSCRAVSILCRNVSGRESEECVHRRRRLPAVSVERPHKKWIYCAIVRAVGRLPGTRSPSWRTKRAAAVNRPVAADAGINCVRTQRLSREPIAGIGREGRRL